MSTDSKLWELIKQEDILDATTRLRVADKISEDSKLDLEKFLIKEKILGPEKLTELKASLHELPYKNLVELEVPKDALFYSRRYCS